jgi:hypothetical protein
MSKISRYCPFFIHISLYLFPIFDPPLHLFFLHSLMLSLLFLIPCALLLLPPALTLPTSSTLLPLILPLFPHPLPSSSFPSYHPQPPLPLPSLLPLLKAACIHHSHQDARDSWTRQADPQHSSLSTLFQQAQYRTFQVYSRPITCNFRPIQSPL